MLKRMFEKGGQAVNQPGCVAKTLLGQSFLINQLTLTQQLRKFQTRILLAPGHRLFRILEERPLRIMFIAS